MDVQLKFRTKKLSPLKISICIKKRKTAILFWNIPFNYNLFYHYYAKQLSYEVWRTAFMHLIVTLIHNMSTLLFITLPLV